MFSFMDALSPFSHNSQKHSEFIQSFSPSVFKPLFKFSYFNSLCFKFYRPFFAERDQKVLGDLIANLIDDSSRLLIIKSLGGLDDILQVIARDLNATIVDGL